jgi:hypothetical protein
MSSRSEPRPSGHRFPWPLLPICVYLVITVVLPALNGAAMSPGFWRHALWIFGGCAVVGVVMWALGTVVEWIRDAARSVRKGAW